MIDNMMGLTHKTYVGASSIGQREIDEAPCRTRTVGEHVSTSRYMNGVQAQPFWQAPLEMNVLPVDQPVDRWQVCHFEPPSHVLVEVGVALAAHGGQDAPDERKVSALVVDFIKPETPTSMWYYWGMARRFKPTDASLTARFREGQGRIFDENRQMLEQQQRNLLAHSERRLLSLNIDADGVAARRLIDLHIAAERTAPAAAACPWLAADNYLERQLGIVDAGQAAL